MFRPVVTTTAPVNAIVTNSSLYQPQQQTFVAQNNLPKIGAIKATTLGANAQQKILNIVAPQKQITTTTATAATTSIQQNTNTIQHIKTVNSVSHQIVQNGTNIATIADNIIQTTPVASQIISNTLTNLHTPAIHSQAIKSEVLVTSSSIDSKAATSNTNVQSASHSVAATPVSNPINNTLLSNAIKEQPAEINSIIDQQPTHDTNDDENEPEPEIDIVINNVVCSFSVRCHLNLREIALNGKNVEFRRENGMVTMKLRRPYTTASIWSSGRITCTGATSEDQVNLTQKQIFYISIY